ncbi:MAG: cytochrome c biogenesis CcdA family protein [Acidimicrobiia bacterium]
MSDVTNHVALFGAGVASFLAPCVVPLMPAYVGMMAGEIAGATPGDRVDATAPRAGTIARAGMIFVTGFTAVFVALGAFAGQLGSSLDSFQLWAQRAGGVMVVLFGLVGLGVGHRWVPERRIVARIPATGHVARPLVMGVAFGAAWTPCVGPLLGAALIVAARAADPWHGASLLGAYALGVGVPFLAAALAVASSPTLLARLRRSSTRVQPVAGTVLVVLGVLLFTGTYASILGPLARLLPGSI